MCVLNHARIVEITERNLAIQKARQMHDSKVVALKKSQILSIEEDLLMYPPVFPEIQFIPPVIDPQKIHPHIQNLLGIEVNAAVVQVLAEISTTVKPKQTDKGKGPCPRCKGQGYTHDSSAKHDKKNERCKACVNCKGSSI
jgi:hypothetical protein